MEPKQIKQLEREAYDFTRSAQEAESKTLTTKVGDIAINIVATQITTTQAIAYHTYCTKRVKN